MSYFGAAVLALLICTVLVRVALLRRHGVVAMKFGKTDKTDFLIPPFALLYLYLVVAGALGWPTVASRLFRSLPLQLAGGLCCAAGLILLICSVVSFGSSFRVGIDADNPDRLVTSGVFALTRNPIYVAFAFVLLGEFLIQPSWIFLLYLIAGIALFHRQVLREEAYLLAHYGTEYEAYGERVPRYLWRA